MSVLKRDLLFRGSANMPDVDGSTTGGAIDWTKKITFVDITPNGTMSYVSSSASDTAATIAVSGRDATGVIQTETKTLTGTTVVAGSQTFERLLKGVQGGTTPVGDIAAISTTAILSTRTAQAGANASGTTDASITLASGDGASCAIGDVIRITNNSPAGVNFQLREIIALSGDIAYVNADWGTAPTSASQYNVHQGMLFQITYFNAASTSGYRVAEVRRPFYNAASDVSGGSTRNYYEKVFAVNINTATALTVAQLIKQADPSSGTLNFALTNVLNDTGTIANRQTAPSSGITSFSSGSAPQTINVPSPQNLPSGATPNAAGAQGVWLQLQLTAGLAPAKTSFTMRTTGQTT